MSLLNKNGFTLIKGSLGFQYGFFFLKDLAQVYDSEHIFQLVHWQ